jgi:desulfoferrodoxin (superoxide reductase-like protein)
MLLSLALLEACGQTGEQSSTAEKIKPKTIYELHNKEFLSLENPGPWKEQPSIPLTHIPQYTVSKNDTAKIISVTVPLNVDRRHYIEAIILLDGSFKELRKKNLDRGETPAAVFNLPLDFKDKVYIMIKCSQHDMWIAPVNW